MREKVQKILADIESLKERNEADCRLPENVFYLNDEDILCLERKDGESRYPYEMDGLNLWAHSNGHINACESNLVIFRTAGIQEEPSVDFWLLTKRDGHTVPISITGATKHMYEPEDVSRYTVYSKRAAYYIVKTSKCTASLRVSVTTDKEICFTVCVINGENANSDITVVSYIDPMVRFTNNEDPWALLKRYGWYDGKGSFKILRYPNPENQDVVNLACYAVINRSVESGSAYDVEGTVAKSVFLGDRGRCLFNAVSLKEGCLSKRVYSINTADLPVASEFITLHLGKGENAEIAYLTKVVHDGETADGLMGRAVDLKKIESDLAAQERAEDKKMGGLEIEFGGENSLPANCKVFNHFLKNVQKQVTFCALGKNYAGDLLGVRDVFQQLTAASLWNRDNVREKIVLALNFIMDNGRAPRQFSVPPTDDVIPTFDIRQFIDQGLWIVETLHKYISITDDLTILDEKCSYYHIIDEKKAKYQKSGCTDTVLDHLLKITGYLTSNIDNRTGCLRILYGDWNDAVCGLGESLDGKSEFGTGVSVMATLQLYKALEFMSEILSLVGGYDDTCRTYEEIRRNMADGLEKYAMQKDGDRVHLIHGWGDGGKYLVGSLCDTDGKCRYSVNPYSFWCISGMIKRNPSLKADILKAYDVLDSKYGIKTFEPYFPSDMKGVGRIVSLTPGTFENSCAYIHATMFAVMALFELGEPERAWEQIKKAVPLTHSYLNKTPFVMPNSYCYNEEFCIDGESGGDWYTGSGAVLMRCIIEHALGISVSPKGIKIEVPHFIPSDFVKITLTVKHSKITLTCTNKHTGERKYYVNGKERKAETSMFGEKGIFLENAELTENMAIDAVY